LVVDVRDVITCFIFGDDRFTGLASAGGQILPFPIDFDGRPYNTLTLPCERVIHDPISECRRKSLSVSNTLNIYITRVICSVQKLTESDIRTSENTNVHIYTYNTTAS